MTQPHIALASPRRSREYRQELNDTTLENTQLRLTDSLLLFETGSLAPGVIVRAPDVRIRSSDAGMKYRGIFIQREAYDRWLENFDADGALPVARIIEKAPIGVMRSSGGSGFAL
jgi:hypothetical protein